VGGTLRIGLRSPPSTLNNLLWTSLSDGNYHRLFLNPTLLIEGPDLDATGSVHPHAAMSHPEHLEGGRSFVFHLKADLAWENGRALTSSDYAETLDYLRDPRVPCASLRSEFESIESIQVLDERRFQVRFREPTWNGGQRFGLGFRVMPVKEIRESGVEMDPRLPVMGFGPYRVAESTQELLTLVLRDAYRTSPHPLGPRYVERLQFRFIADPEAATILMKAGEIDVLPVDVEKFLNAREDKELMEVAWRTSYILPVADVIGFNLRDPDDLSKPHPVLSDARVRTAFAHLYPREGILAEREGGLGVIHDGPFDFRDPGRATSHAPLPFDPARAAALFDEAGFVRGKDGWRARGDQALRMAVFVLAGRNYWTEPLSYFRSEARKVGAEVDVKVIPSGLSQLVSSRKFDAFIALRRSSPMVAPDLYSDFHSS
ncbi:MAG TPA: ABC transporter substrate-binding protein, partial [Planctomycetota bacterium]|nr:ABC transporter substrate-binding protein [Planctomycetota bacterium]